MNMKHTNLKGLALIQQKLHQNIAKMFGRWSNINQPTDQSTSITPHQHQLLEYYKGNYCIFMASGWY